MNTSVRPMPAALSGHNCGTRRHGGKRANYGRTSCRRDGPPNAAPRGWISRPPRTRNGSAAASTPAGVRNSQRPLLGAPRLVRTLLEHVTGLLLECLVDRSAIQLALLLGAPLPEVVNRGVKHLADRLLRTLSGICGIAAFLRSWACRQSTCDPFLWSHPRAG